MIRVAPNCQTRLNKLDEARTKRRGEVLPGRDAWEQDALARLESAGQTHPLDITSFESLGESNHRVLPDKSVLLVDDAPDRDTYVVTVKTPADRDHRIQARGADRSVAAGKRSGARR
jgi:hypothetical protein